MKIRKATPSDFERACEIYDSAREFMARNGNPNQWINNYPQRNITMQDIEDGILYVCERDNTVHAVFTLYYGEDATYGFIKDGQWLNNLPYAAVHRVASDMTVKGITKYMFDFCKTQYNNLKCDTHFDNIPMQRALEKNGFIKCGVIYTHNGTERVAYQFFQK